MTPQRVGQSPDAAELDPVALTQDEVDEFMASAKRVSGETAQGAREMRWRSHNQNQADWDAPLEVDAVTVGNVYLFVSPLMARQWLFKLHLHGEEVFGWHIRPIFGNHSNPKGCRGFPAKVREPEHAHYWIEGVGCKCAKPLKGLGGCSHEETLARFCTATRLEFEPAYHEPPWSDEQLRLGV